MHITKKTNFIFNGINSESLGVSSIQNYNETSDENEAIKISITLVFNENLTFDKEQEIKRWLETDDFCKLQFDDSKYRYNAMINGRSRKIHDHNGNTNIEIEFLTDSKYKFLDDIVSGQSESDTEYVELSIDNKGSKTVCPVIEITAPGIINGIEIFNTTTNQQFILSGEYTDLTMTIINEKEELDTEGNFTNLYENHNDVFIHFIRGRNDLKLKGLFQYKITYQNIYL